MKVTHDPWPADEAEALRQQLALRERVEPTGPPLAVRTVAGLDVSYDDETGRAVAAVVVLDLETLAVVHAISVAGDVAFPYVPGLLAFREMPLLVDALERMRGTIPDVLVCDGYGLAHPRRFGLACHVGVLTGLPTFGVAKTPFTAAHARPGTNRGDWSPLTEDGEVLGRVVRTQPKVKPVFVSVGHRIDLDTATALTLKLSPRFRLPETTRRADQFSRRLLRAQRVAR
ncbi:endonuclease V [Catellatospora sichuanensis]|uniref:endonuclease V n=1 Tax=Catellatospora sichuanensis TaxID=1969805 RepID=UPI0011826BA9|nr:endonuclease V [Catellatospora sichuanensis]